MLTIDGIDKHYANGFQALDKVDLAIAEGSFTSIVGPSGVEKALCCG